MRRNRITMFYVVFAVCSVLLPLAHAQDLSQTIQQKVAQLKESIVLNQQALRQYSWIENTQLSLKGEVKNTKIEQCRYGADGKIQKTLLTEPPKQEKKRGIKGKIVEKKTGEMKDYMERAMSLVSHYVPPAPDKLQAVVAAGKAGLNQAGPGAVQLQFKDYYKSGDLITLTFDTEAKAIRQFKVDSYLDDQNDKVGLTVDFNALPDGTSYTATKTLNAASKEIVVKIASSNYQKLAN